MYICTCTCSIETTCKNTSSVLFNNTVQFFNNYCGLFLYSVLQVHVLCTIVHVLCTIVHVHGRISLNSNRQCLFSLLQSLGDYYNFYFIYKFTRTCMYYQ